MTTPSGQISLNDVNVELGLAGTTTISMNQTNVRTLAGVPSGAISMQNLQNKSNRVTASATISSDTANYVLNTAKASGYSAGKTDMTLTINSGVNVYSGSTGSYALTVDTSWAAGDTVTIVNNGVIVGRGGNGTNGSVSYGSYNRASPGGTGGPALLVQRAITMNNLNRIAGGGGGGGGGNWGSLPYGKGVQPTGGGGGGGGVSFGGGGSGGYSGPPLNANGSPGGTATVSSAGGGGGGGGNSGPPTNGGAGGGYGSSGSGGGAGAMPGAGPSGGAAGACIVGNSNITYINTGTRSGSIS